MMIGKAVRKWLGQEELIQELRDERSGQRELVARMLAVTESQAETSNRLLSVIESIYNAYQTDGTLPESRHLSEEQEDEILEKEWYGSDDDDGA